MDTLFKIKNFKFFHSSIKRKQSQTQIHYANESVRRRTTTMIELLLPEKKIKSIQNEKSKHIF